MRLTRDGGALPIVLPIPTTTWSLNPSPLGTFATSNPGEGGRWEADCIRNGTIRLGYASHQHEAHLVGKWEEVKAHWLARRHGKQGVAPRDVKQIRDFCELAETDIRITFHQR